MTINRFMSMCAGPGLRRFLMWMKKSSCGNLKVLKSKISIKPSVLPKRIET